MGLTTKTFVSRFSRTVQMSEQGSMLLLQFVVFYRGPNLRTRELKRRRNVTILDGQRERNKRGKRKREGRAIERNGKSEPI